MIYDQCGDSIPWETVAELMTEATGQGKDPQIQAHASTELTRIIETTVEDVMERIRFLRRGVDSSYNLVNGVGSSDDTETEDDAQSPGDSQAEEGGESDAGGSETQ